jgi:uncharacterized Zn-finger protein
MASLLPFSIERLLGSSYEKKKFECRDCGKQFNAHYNLTRHMPVHTGARPFLCKVGVTCSRSLNCFYRYVARRLDRRRPCADTRSSTPNRNHTW